MKEDFFFFKGRTYSEECAPGYIRNLMKPEWFKEVEASDEIEMLIDVTVSVDAKASNQPVKRIGDADRLP